MKNIDINDLTLEEKIAIVSGTEYMLTNPIPRLSFPSAICSDGPHGIRKTSTIDVGIACGLKATAFPTASAVASSFNEENSFLLGQALGKEAKHFNVDVVLGPGMNIKRNPLCGRNFEYYSEDPYLSGTMAKGEVRGIHSVDCNCCIKHFAVNSNENYRLMGENVVDERALREIYLKSFEMVIKDENPSAIMCAYNQVNGYFCSENSHLLKDILRDEWKYEGLVMSDWGAVKDKILSLKAGLDLDMPGDVKYFRKQLEDAIKNNELDINVLDNSVKRVIDFVNKTHIEERLEIDFDKHHELSGDIATDCAVLLKNDNDFYPLKEGEKVLMVGDMYKEMQYQGSGSSLITPIKFTSPCDAFLELGKDYTYLQGYKLNEDLDESLIEEVVNKCSSFDKIILYIGLDDNCDIEGVDRKSLLLPENQVKLIERLVSLNKRVGLVAFGGSSFIIPSIEKIEGVLMMHLPGQNGGKAVASLLLGESSPSGRLAETWMQKYEDVPFFNEYTKTSQDLYKESVYVGYRYYTSFSKPVSFPFGHGLSYTKFEKNIINVIEEKDSYKVTCNIKNVGPVEGKDVILLFVEAPQNLNFRPLRELKAFKKVSLLPQEEKEVELIIKKDDLKIFNIKTNEFVLDGGKYLIQLCENCNTVIDTKEITLDLPVVECFYTKKVNDIYRNNVESVDEATFKELYGRDIKPLPKEKPFTLETRITEFNKSIIGKLIYKIMRFVLKQNVKKAKKIKDETERKLAIKNAKFIVDVFHYNSMRAITMMAPTIYGYNFALAIVNLANGHILKGLRLFFKKIDACPLPKDK